MIGAAVFPDTPVIQKWFDFQYFQIHEFPEWFVFQYFQVPGQSKWFVFQHSTIFGSTREHWGTKLE